LQVDEIKFKLRVADLLDTCSGSIASMDRGEICGESLKSGQNVFLQDFPFD
jgi:hypothetical protein